MRVDLVMRPYKYMRRYGPKEGKKSRKSAFLFLKSSYMIGGVCKIVGYGVWRMITRRRSAKNAQK